MKRWLFQAGSYCIGGTLVLLAIGVEWWRALLIGVCAFAVLASMRWWPTGWYSPWPKQPQRSYGGGTYQVANLAARLEHRKDRRRLPDPTVQHRLRTLAVAKLARMDIPWPGIDERDHDAPARAALGNDVYAALRAETFAPDLRTTAHIVSVIENLDTAAEPNREGRQ